MPLKSGKSKKTITSNIRELVKKPSSKRVKAIKTLSKNSGISYEEAKRKQAVAIALNVARKPRVKSKK